MAETHTYLAKKNWPLLLSGLLATLLLSACSHRAPFEPKDGPPKLRKDISAVQDAVPKVEPKARYGNHSPYQVFGKTYHVMESSDGYREEGIASWYGEKFAGRSTSSMEPYDPYLMTAAHKSLPLPSYVRVTNLKNNRSVVVRVNDRGPFHGDRIIDLSYAAAIKLGYANQGTAPVLVEIIDPNRFQSETPQTTHASKPHESNKPAEPVESTAQVSALAMANPSASPTATGPKLYLQAGAFSQLASAHRLQDQLRVVLNAEILVNTEDKNGTQIHRVYVGPFAEEQQARAAQAVIRDTELAEPLLVKR